MANAIAPPIKAIAQWKDRDRPNTISHSKDYNIAPHVLKQNQAIALSL